MEEWERLEQKSGVEDWSNKSYWSNNEVEVEELCLEYQVCKSGSMEECRVNQK